MRPAILVFSLLAYFFFSCGSKSTESTSRDKDSTAAPQYSQAFRDSFALARMEKFKRDSLIIEEQGKAIGNINFGITEREFERQKKRFLKSVSHDDEPVTYYALGDYRFSYLDGRFYNDSLYLIEFSGDFVKYDEYSSAIPLYKSAIDGILIEKFGKPQVSYPLQARNLLSDNSTYRSASWEVGRKFVATSINTHGLYYSYDMTIYLPEINGKIRELEGRKSTNERKNAIDKI